LFVHCTRSKVSECLAFVDSVVISSVHIYTNQLTGFIAQSREAYRHSTFRSTSSVCCLISSLISYVNWFNWLSVNSSSSCFSWNSCWRSFLSTAKHTSNYSSVTLTVVHNMGQNRHVVSSLTPVWPVFEYTFIFVLKHDFFLRFFEMTYQKVVKSL